MYSVSRSARVLSLLKCALMLSCTRAFLGRTFAAALVARTCKLSMSSAAGASVPEVVPVRILNDNYAYLLIDRGSKVAAAVDPAEPDKLLDAAKKLGVEIKVLLCTHKHWDHAGGNEAMAAKIPGLDVVGSAYEEVPAATIRLSNDDVYRFGGLSIRALHAPCHTRGHVLFYVTQGEENGAENGEIAEGNGAEVGGREGDVSGSGGGANAPLLFAGDTLFVGGCGRFFEGDGNDMAKALSMIAELPPQTKVFCGHDYTVSNLQFAASIEPENAAVTDKLRWARDTLRAGGVTVPSTVGEELTYNPFMRCAVGEEPVRRAMGFAGDGQKDVGAVMDKLRSAKNSYSPPSSL